MGTVSPLLSRLEAIRARRDGAYGACPNCGSTSNSPCRRCAMYGAHGGACKHASDSKPTSISPYVRMAREKRLRPTFCGGSFLPDGTHAA